MNPFFGVILHAIGGLAAGSFYIPFRKVKKWAWESYWLIQGVAAWVIMPFVGAYLTTPELGTVLLAAPMKNIFWAYLFGVLWGVGGLTFGLSMRYLGMSLGYAVSLGFCAAFGTLVPPIFDGKFMELLSVPSGKVLLLGVFTCLFGIAVCGLAGMRKETELTDEQKKETIKEFSLVKGLLVAVFAGVMSSCMNFAITAGKPIAEAAIAAGAADIYSNNPIYIIVMAGGFTTNFLWCLVLNIRNRTIKDYSSGTKGALFVNYVFASLAGIIWYGQFFFFGMGKTQMGKYDFASWTIHMAFIIVFSNLWGLSFHEWRGSSRRTFRVILTGLAILTLSTVIVGVSNYLAGLEKLALK